jgi:hypothetical protein
VNGKSLFKKRVFFPFWPLLVALIVGYALNPRVHVFWSGIAIEISYLLGFLITTRYLVAMKYGAPVIAWMLWLGIAFGVSFVSMFFVSMIVYLVI